MRWLAASSALPLVGCADDPQDRTFPQGIASGDPTSDGILLWTRVEPFAPDAIELVAYEVACDPDFRAIVAGGTVDALPDADHTVRVAIAHLAAGTTYWYRFRARGATSPIGRTRTAPARDADAPLRIALASCQDYGGRWFGAWRAIDDDVDLVLFIGDYIYETIGHLAAVLPPDRTPAIPDGLVLDDPLKGSVAALTLADYRALYRQYRRDPDLRAVHARFPFVMMWDDHEFANDCWRDHATDFDDARGDERSPERRAAATRAWYDYCPVRRDRELYRSLRWGRHAELVLIDERSYRDDDLIPEGPVDAEVGHVMMNSAFGARTFVIKDAFDAREAAAVPPPSMLGAAQRDWAIAAVQGSTATWKLLASPLVMAQLVIDLTGYAQLPDQFRKRFYFKTDQWDGFRSERRALLEACAGVDNVVVLSGDLHGFYAAELHADFDAPAAEPVAVEYAVSAISAATVDVQLDAVVAAYPLLGALGLADLVPQFDANARAANRHLVYSESTRNGLAIVDVAADEVRVRFVHVDDVTSPDSGPGDSVAFRTPLGSRRVLPYGG
jgi:alkaline phosphatase D